MLLDNIICQTEKCVLQSRVVPNFSPEIPNISQNMSEKCILCVFLFYLGDLVTNTGEQEIQSVYGRLPIWDSWLR